ncbi:MAG TPA: porin [Gammaproteobacteria bacterium]
MKLKFPALYSAAVLLAAGGNAMAEVDVYGKANITVQNSDEGGASQVELKSNASRFGLKGDEDIGEGLKVIYRFEWEVDPDGKSGADNFSARNQFVGLAGFFGTLKVGRHDTALKTAQGDFDLFNDLSGDIKNILNGENRLGNYIGYTTPEIADAFSVTVNLFPGEDAAAGNDGIADGTSISLNYETDTVYAALARDSDIDGVGVDTTRAMGGYKFGAAQVNVLYQQTDAGALDGDGYGASFAYGFGRNTFKLQYVDADIYQTGVDSDIVLENQASVGLDRRIGDSTKLFGFYTTGDVAATGESNDYFGVGIEHKF